MGDEQKIKEAFKKALSDSALSRRLALSGGVLSVLTVALFLLFSSLFVLHSFFSSWDLFPFSAFLFFWAGVICAVVFSVSSPFFHPADKKKLAGILDKKTGRYKSLLGSAFEFSSSKKKNKGYSLYLMEETIRRANKDITKLKEGNIFAGEGRPEWTAAGILLGILFLFQVGFAPAAINDILPFISDPGISFRVSKGANILVSSGNISILEGEGFFVEGVNFGSEVDEVFLCTNSVDEIWREKRLDPETIYAGNAPILIFRKHLGSPSTNLLYCFRSGNNFSDTFKVNVIYRPVINSMNAKLDYPDYTGMISGTVKTVAGKLGVPFGTRIDISGETSKDIAEGHLFFASGKVVPVEVSTGGFGVSFTAQADDTFYVSVTDQEGYKNRQRIVYPVQVINDLPPGVEILAPEDRAQLPRSLLISMHYRAVDDYSVNGINLRFKKDKRDKEYKTIILPGAGGKNSGVVEEVYKWSLKGNAVMPGDRIFYYLEAFDNNVHSGPGYARTEIRSLEVPSLSQMYANHRKNEAGQTKQIDDLYQFGVETKEILKRLSDKFKAEPKMDWGEKREGKMLLDKYKNLRRKSIEAASQLEKTLDALQQNRMTSMSIGKKLERIQQLMSRLESERLKKIIEETNRIIDELSEEEIASAMENLEISTEDMIAELDRTIDFLKQVMREEKVEELMRRMESMLERQKALRDSARTENLEELSEGQEELGEEAEKFKEDLDSLSGEEEFRNNEEMQNLKKDMAQANLDSLMEKAAEQLRRGERNSARCTQKETMDEMLGLYTSLGRFQMGMNLTMKEHIKKGIQNTAARLIETSMVQEEVVEGLLGGGMAGVGIGTAEKELVVKEAVKRVIEELYMLSRKSMFKSQLVFTHLGGAARGIEETLSGIENRRRGQARDSAIYALCQLNKGVIELLRAGSSSQGSGSGSRKKMQMMLSRQMAIDSQLQGMYRNQNRSSLSMSQRAEMSRLAAKQRKMEEVMKQIEKESGDSDNLLGKIEGLASQMDSVAGKLEEGKLSRDLIGMEEKILGRMLQAQRSLNRRDYKRERVSRSAEALWGEDPGPMMENEESREIILEMIRKGMRMKGPQEYEDLIELYFRALSRQIRKQGE